MPINFPSKSSFFSMFKKGLLYLGACAIFRIEQEALQNLLKLE